MRMGTGFFARGVVVGANTHAWWRVGPLTFWRLQRGERRFGRCSRTSFFCWPFFVEVG